MFRPHAFLCGPRLRARRVFIQRSGRLALALRYLYQGFISNLLLQIIVDFGIWKRKSCSESPLVHSVKVYRCSTPFPLLTDRKFEPNSTVDETVAREHQVLSLYTRLWLAGGTKQTHYLRPHQFPKFYIRYTPSLNQPYKTLCFFRNLRYKEWRKKRFALRPKCIKESFLWNVTPWNKLYAIEYSKLSKL